MEGKTFKQMAHISQEYTRLKQQDPSISGFALIDDQGYSILQQNIPKSTVLRNVMTICNQLFEEKGNVTVAIEGVSRTLWLKEKEENYVMAVVKNTV